MGWGPGGDVIYTGQPQPDEEVATPLHSPQEEEAKGLRRAKADLVTWMATMPRVSSKVLHRQDHKHIVSGMARKANPGRPRIKRSKTWLKEIPRMGELSMMQALLPDDHGLAIMEISETAFRLKTESI